MYITHMSYNNTTSGVGQANSLPEPPYIWYWTLRGISCFLTVFGNGLIIYLILTRKRLQNTTNWLTLSLAVADFLIGAGVIPSSFVCFFCVQCNWDAINRLFKLLFFVSVANLCALTLDRFVAVEFPFRYFLLKRNKTRLLLVSSAWLIPTCFKLIPLSWENSAKDVQFSAWPIFLAVETVVLVVLPCALMLLAYGRIWYVTHRQARVIKSHDNDIHGNRTQVRNCTRVRREGRSSLRVYGLLVVLFVACWSLSGYRYVCLAFELREISDTVTAFSRLLMLVNSAVNFVVYAFFKKDIRLELVKSLRKIAGLQVNPIGDELINLPGPAQSGAATQRPNRLSNQELTSDASPFTTETVPKTQ